jgi:hypothetical protein
MSFVPLPREIVLSMISATPIDQQVSETPVGYSEDANAIRLASVERN